MNDHRTGGVIAEIYDPYPPAKARDKATLEQQIMDAVSPRTTQSGGPVRKQDDGKTKTSGKAMQGTRGGRRGDDG